MGNLLGWLLNPAQDSNGNPLPFNAWPWYLAFGVFVIAAAYYWAEGRRKIPWIKDHTVWKRMVFDRLSQQVGWFGFVGLIVVAIHQAMYYTLFSFPLWMVAQVLWGAGIAVYWAIYFVRDHNRNMIGYDKLLERNRYLPQANRNRRTSSAH